MISIDPDRVAHLVRTALVFNGGESVLIAPSSPAESLAAARELGFSEFSHLKNGYPVYTR